MGQSSEITVHENIQFFTGQRGSNTRQITTVTPTEIEEGHHLQFGRSDNGKVYWRVDKVVEKRKSSGNYKSDPPNHFTLIVTKL